MKMVWHVPLISANTRDAESSHEGAHEDDTSKHYHTHFERRQQVTLITPTLRASGNIQDIVLVQLPLDLRFLCVEHAESMYT